MTCARIMKFQEINPLVLKKNGAWDQRGSSATGKIHLAGVGSVILSETRCLRGQTQTNNLCFLKVELNLSIDSSAARRPPTGLLCPHPSACLIPEISRLQLQIFSHSVGLQHLKTYHGCRHEEIPRQEGRQAHDEENKPYCIISGEKKKSSQCFFFFKISSKSRFSTKK